MKGLVMFFYVLAIILWRLSCWGLCLIEKALHHLKAKLG